MQIKTNELINFSHYCSENSLKFPSERISNLIKFLQKEQHDNLERDISFIYSLLPSTKEEKEKLKELELAANDNRLNKNKIFEIYKQVPFNLNTLINAKDSYQSLNESDARALLYQKYLLSDSNDAKIDYLFLLEVFLPGSQNF